MSRKRCCKKRCKLGTRKNPYDYVIVGAGTAGAPLAKFLSDPAFGGTSKRMSVFVLEAGPNLANNPGVLARPTTEHVEGIADWSRVADTADINSRGPLSDGPVIYNEGRMWGGSSGHNFGLAVRGTPDIYDSWGAIDNRWSYSNLLPAMKFLETYTPDGTVANPAQRGVAGPLFVTQEPPLPPSNPFIAAFSAVNTFPVSDYNNPSLGNVGVSASQIYVNPSTNQRSWSASAFLGSDVVDFDGHGVGRRQLTIESLSTAKKVIIERGKAVGVRYVRHGGKDVTQKIVDVFAKKKVVLATGTIADAALLQRSGIGPAALLESLSIPVVFDNPNVGANMQCHVGPTALTPIDISNPPPAQGINAFTDLSGVNVGPATGVREIQFIAVAAPDLVIPRAVMAALALDPDQFYINWIAADLRPSRLGTVEILSQDELVEPEVKFHFYQNTDSQTELEKAVLVYKIIANVSLTYSGQMPNYPPQAHYPAPYGPAPDDSLLEEDAKGVSIFFNHAVGSCRMGTSSADGVVDGQLDVFGVKNLSCCSNSVQPSSTTGNTSWPAYLFGMIKAKIENANVPF